MDSSLLCPDEGMNPERVRMLLEAEEEEEDVTIKLENEEFKPLPPPVIGANGAPMGDWTQRLQRKPSEPAIPSTQNTVLPESHQLTHKENQSLLKRPACTNNKAEKKKRKKERMQQSKAISQYPPSSSLVLPQLNPAPAPDVHTEHLESMLQCQPFQLKLQIPVSLRDESTPAESPILELQISGVGLLHHQLVSGMANIPVFDLASTTEECIYHSIEGQLLEDVWASLTLQDKYMYAHQLRDIIQSMRKAKVTGRSGPIGSAICGPYSLILDKHADHTYYAIRSHLDNSQFIAFLVSSFYTSVPKTIMNALATRIRSTARSTLTHGELCPRNIIVRNRRIVAIVGWDFAGWYPIWWEYVKFFEAKTSEQNNDWYEYVSEIFTEESHQELALYQGLVRCQRR